MGLALILRCANNSNRRNKKILPSRYGTRLRSPILHCEEHGADYGASKIKKLHIASEVGISFYFVNCPATGLLLKQQSFITSGPCEERLKSRWSLRERQTTDEFTDELDDWYVRYLRRWSLRGANYEALVEQISLSMPC